MDTCSYNNVSYVETFGYDDSRRVLTHHLHGLGSDSQFVLIYHPDCRPTIKLS